MPMSGLPTAAGLLLALTAFPLAAQAQPVAGEVTGKAWQHTAASAVELMSRADVALPARATGGEAYFGKLADVPQSASQKVPVVLFLHGSGGLALKAIGEWQRWLAAAGYASVAPDSMALPDRITYTSPVDKETYEKIHALRASEILIALDRLRSLPWADPTRLVLSGASEGGPAVARYAGDAFVGRIIFSWSCEDNYFVTSHQTAVRPNDKILNVMSTSDPYFSSVNPWLGASDALGYCGRALGADKSAMIVLIPGAPHTLLNLPQAHVAVLGWLGEVVGESSRPQ
jgi:dienelactone hydrolase